MVSPCLDTLQLRAVTGPDSARGMRPLGSSPCALRLAVAPSRLCALAWAVACRPGAASKVGSVSLISLTVRPAPLRFAPLHGQTERQTRAAAGNAPSCSAPYTQYCVAPYASINSM